MSDRELLELAAKAAGEVHGEWIGNAAYFDGVLSRWNPLTDDGDALRLAVKIGADVCIDGNQVAVYGNHDGPPPIETGPDASANARRAITRAAAEIGRRMQHE